MRHTATSGITGRVERRVIVIGASAGGVEALSRLVHGLPPDLPAPVFIVLHRPPLRRSYLAEILARAGPLPAIEAEDNVLYDDGHIYVASPDQHLLIDHERIHLSRGPSEHHHRPSINALFRSAAAAFGTRAIGVVLTGALDDGTEGLQEIKRHGGIAIVEDPEEAVFPDMPASALARVDVDFVSKLECLGPLLATIVHQPASTVALLKDDEALPGRL